VRKHSIFTVTHYSTHWHPGWSVSAIAAF